jgi:hypothetical protein
MIETIVTPLIQPGEFCDQLTSVLRSGAHTGAWIETFKRGSMDGPYRDKVTTWFAPSPARPARGKSNYQKVMPKNHCSTASYKTEPKLP